MLTGFLYQIYLVVCSTTAKWILNRNVQIMFSSVIYNMKLTFNIHAIYIDRYKNDHHISKRQALQYHQK